ncbi:MAG: ABC transporter ATP-binding protein [Eggerthellaceae bacterium]|nr:ABC transporter ATP-binding protein [Eggerthellaceae bacterium]
MNLSLQHISVCYDNADGTQLEAVRDVSLEVEGGQAVALIGPSGCGKSTLLRIACGLLTPTSGSVRIGGEELAGPRSATALILQDFGLLPWKTVYKNAELGLRIRGVSKDECKKRTMHALSQVGLADMANRYPKELSGGMQQRLALARALALDVDLLLMDEPLSALDALLRESLQETLLKLWHENRHAHVLVTHSIEEAVYLGQRIVVFSPRPASVAAVIDNPHMGEEGFRTSQAYFECCTEVREALNRVVATDARSEASQEGRLA